MDIQRSDLLGGTMAVIYVAGQHYLAVRQSASQL